MAASVTLRGEGGVLWDFELPLSEVYADQVRRGRLTAADEDSEKALAKSGVSEAATASPDAGGEAEEPPMAGSGSGRNAWAAYAEAIGLAVTNGMTKAEIVEAVKAAKAE